MKFTELAPSDYVESCELCGKLFKPTDDVETDREHNLVAHEECYEKFLKELGIHREHCCPKYGCKYGDRDCPVVLGIVYPEYECDDEKWSFKNAVRKIKEKEEVKYEGFNKKGYSKTG